MRLLDLFCCAGGATRGYQMAGFHVTGVDVKPQSRYCGDAFIQADVLSVSPSFLAGFDAIHASPPCQGYTALRHAPGTVGAPRLIARTRRLLKRAGVPFVIENVAEAASDMSAPVTLCGTMFGLGAEGCELRRHRLFETGGWTLVPPGPCRHSNGPVVGVYGGHARKRSARHGGRGTADRWPSGHKPVAMEAMGMDWATLAEMSEAIPPAYTRFIGEQLQAALQQPERAAA